MTPKGFKIPGQEDKVHLLKKAIYGLKQASRSNKKIHTVLQEIGYKQSSHKPCVYFKTTENNSSGYLCRRLLHFFKHFGKKLRLKNQHNGINLKIEGRINLKIDSK